jgi:hypothetical protein
LAQLIVATCCPALLQLAHGQRRRRRFTSITTGMRANFFTNDSGGYR